MLGDGVALVREIAKILKDDGRHLTQVLAVSIKSPAEAVAALNAGAQHVALPLEVVKQMASHPLSEQAIQQFDLISG